MASMGISTHSAPFKPPFPPFIWLSSSRSFWRASPKMSLLRLIIYKPPFASLFFTLRPLLRCFELPILYFLVLTMFVGLYDNKLFEAFMTLMFLNYCFFTSGS